MNPRRIAGYLYRFRFLNFLVAGMALPIFGLMQTKPSHHVIVCFIAACVITGAAGYLVHGELIKATLSKRPPRTEYISEPLILGELIYETDVEAPLKDWMQHETYQRPAQISVVGSSLRFVTPPKTADEWDYVFLDPAAYRWKDFSWNLKFKRETKFREYAFNFRYQDFDNRYRYRFEDNKIFFDKKVRGGWGNNIASVFFPMELGRWYELRIDVCATLFRCYVDGRLWLENSDTDLAEGSISLILWEDNKETEIIAEIGPSKVHQLIRNPATNVTQLHA
jgi:hypothetical protein